MKHTFLSLLGCLLMVCPDTMGKVTLPNHFTSNMVVQRQTTLTVRGKAKAGADVTLKASWSKSPVTAAASADGQFVLQIQTPKAGGPYTMTFTDGDDELCLENVLSGEVWLGSGQSNMEMPMAGWGKVLNYEEEISKANYPQIRLLQVAKKTSLIPLDNAELTMSWQECSPKTVENFSALGYYYALRLWEELGVPVGIIDDSWGGTPCEAWVSQEALSGVTGYEDQMRGILERRRDPKLIEAFIEECNAGYNDRLAKVDAGLNGHAPWSSQTIEDGQWPTMKVPCNWESTKVGEFDGLMWFRRTIDIPADWAGKDLTVSLSMTDDQDITYWNGEQVGSTKSFTEKAVYTVPGKLIKAGANVIAIRINDTGGNGGLNGKADEMYVQLSPEQRITLTGDWRYSIGAEKGKLPAQPLAPTNSHYPSVLFNAMLHPFIGFPMRGFIWYQGCTNVGRDLQHEACFQTLITDWRARFGNPGMPFYFVQLANYLAHQDVQPGSEWAALRESQERALCLPNTGMACNIDLGVANDIHPKTKRELAARLAAIALHDTYRKKVPCRTPVYDNYTVEGNTMRIRLRNTDGCEPILHEQDLPGFTMAGPDRKWHAAKADVAENGDLIVTCPDVTQPIAVRYGWANNPTCTLRTKSGLHVPPFRTDRW